MLQFLESGNGVYVVAAICILGILSKLAAHSFYRRAIKQTDNMASTRNRFLKNFRQRTENTYWMNQGIYNARAYIERQVFGYRFLGFSLDAWDGFAGQAVLLSLIAGGIGAYFSYWYQLDSSYIVLYGAAAAMGALAVLFVDQSLKTGQRREQLVVCLQDYIENSMGRRAANRMEKEEKENAEQNKDNVIVSMERGILRGKSADEESEKASMTELKKEENSRVQNTRRGGFVGKRRARGAEQSMSEDDMSALENGRRSSVAEIENLRKSMEQAAAGKDKGLDEQAAAKAQTGVDLTKILEPEQIRVLGEIFKEYLK